MTSTRMHNTARRRQHRAADAVWRRLTEGAGAPWLAEIRDLRADGDDLETALDIWTVALTAAVQDPERRELASAILARLRRMSEEA